MSRATSQQGVSAREPDLILHSEASALAIDGAKEACLKREDPEPLVVIEIVPLGEEGSQHATRSASTLELKRVRLEDGSMPSPMPGMDPYLEHPSSWPNFHHRLITAIAISLKPHLHPKYRVVVEEAIYQTEGQNSVLVGVPFTQPNFSGFADACSGASGVSGNSGGCDE